MKEGLSALGRMTPGARAILVAVPFAAVLAGALAGQAHAQTAVGLQPADAEAGNGRLEALARSFSDGVACTGDKVRDALEDKIRKSGATGGDVGVALALVSSANDVCAPVRQAASAIGADIVAQQIQAAEAARAVAAADTDNRNRLADAALEAEVRTASLKFEITPPPKNLTRGRAPTP